MPILVALLVLVTAAGSKLKKLTYHEADTLLIQHPTLRGELENGFNQRTFKEMRNLEILLHPQPSTGAAVVQGPVVIQAQATQRAWEQDYVGTAVEGLELHIKKYYRTNFEGTNKMDYAHYTSIIQSSGMDV
ncbi:hypothetical protein BU17DRAFT_66038 [Hysterangium stoloniferum]|nr:hypothetical protein BU17DRAFT_66038 [Hysterangium stoloniferum]